MGSQLAWATEAEDVTVIVYYFEGAKAILGVCEWLVNGNGPADVLLIQRVGIGGVDVGVPARPFVARAIGLRMNPGRNGLEANHNVVTPDECPKILAVAVASALVLDFKAELGLVEVEGRLKIIDDEARNDAVERGHGLMVSREAAHHSR